MSQSINDFIASFKSGARPNRFEVIITWPGTVGSPNVLDRIVVQAASLPASTMGSVEVPYFGRKIPVPGDRTFEPWTITVLNDITFSHRNLFESWMNLLNGHESNLQASGNYRDFVTTIDVNQLDRDDSTLKSIKINNAFPTAISAIELGYEQNDQIETYTVTFNYSDWSSADTPTT